jgi:4-amino-4-deoxy-L-arabinose transferase-like glycosyltransferase
MDVTESNRHKLISSMRLILQDARRRLELAALVMIFGVAIFLRVVALDAFPPGVQHDEVFISNFAQTILQGQFPIFFEMNRGNYPLFIYLVALSHQLFGVHVWSLRLVSALSSILGIVMAYSLARVWFNRFAAIMTVIGLTFSFWLLFESRTGLHAVTTFLFAALTFAVFWRGWWNEKPGWLLASGVLAGISMYTYLAGNFIPIALALFVGYSLIFHRDKWTKYYWMAPAIFIIAAIVYAPLGYYLFTHRDTALARVGDLTDVIEPALNGNWVPLLTNILRTIGMFGITGDPEWRYNVANLPVFDPLWAILFYLGVAIATRRFKQPPYAFALIWLVTLMIPTMFSPSNPSQLRSTGAIGVVYMFPAIALATIGYYVLRFTNYAPRIIFNVAVFWLVILAAFTGIWNFFFVWTANSEVRTIYRADLADAAHWLDTNAKSEPILISAEFANDLDRAAFGLESKRDLHPHFFAGADTFVIPASDSALYINPHSGAMSDDIRKKFFATLSPVNSIPNELEIYRVDSSVLNAWRSQISKQSLGVTANNEVELLGAEIPTSGVSNEKARVRVWWRVITQRHTDNDGMLWTIKLVDARGYVWAETNGLGYTPSQWQPGDIVASSFDVEIPADA